jgi:hypothetical protein
MEAIELELLELARLRGEVEQLTSVVARQQREIDALRSVCDSAASGGKHTFDTSAPDASRASRVDADVVCGCNAFNTSTVLVNGDGSGGPTELLVGTPATGIINGVNIVALDNAAVKTTGDQAIAGTLSVPALKVGEWTIAPNANGLGITSAAGGVTVLGAESGLLMGQMSIVGGTQVQIQSGGPPGEVVAAFGLLTPGNPPVKFYIPGGSVNIEGGGDIGSAAPLKIHNTAVFDGPPTVAGHSTDPSTYVVSATECVPQAMTMGGANPFKPCNGLSGSIACPAGKFAVQIETSVGGSNQWDICGHSGAGNGFMCCSVAIAYR